MKVLVFTMEKVGSTSLMRAIKSGGHTVDRAYVGNMDFDFHSYERIVTAVRDPIARNLSWHYESNGEGGPGDRFPLEWIDKYLEPKTGVNVYGTSFPTVKGWKVYSGYLLIVKTELMSKVLKEALTYFCGEADYQVEHQAKGGFKFGGEYDDFIKGSAFHKKLLDRMYESKYAKHFYSPKQIEALRRKWS